MVNMYFWSSVVEATCASAAPGARRVGVEAALGVVTVEPAVVTTAPFVVTTVPFVVTAAPVVVLPDLEK